MSPLPVELRALGRKRRFRRVLPAKTTTTEASFGGAASSTIVIDTMAEKRQYSCESFPLVGQSQSSLPVDMKTSRFEVVKAGTTIKKGSFGAALSLAIELGAMAETNQTSLVTFYTINPLKSPLREIMAEHAFLTFNASQNDYDEGIFWKRAHAINCA